MKELFVLFLLALLILPPIIGIRRIRRFYRDHPRSDSTAGSVDRDSGSDA